MTFNCYCGNILVMRGHGPLASSPRYSLGVGRDRHPFSPTIPSIVMTTFNPYSDAPSFIPPEAPSSSSTSSSISQCIPSRDRAKVRAFYGDEDGGGDGNAALVTRPKTCLVTHTPSPEEVRWAHIIPRFQGPDGYMVPPAYNHLQTCF